MMKRITLALIAACLLTGFARAQQSTWTLTDENFDRKVLRTSPPHRPGVSQKDFDKGSFFIEETVKATSGDPENLNVADYWNISVAFVLLDEPKNHLEIAFRKAIEDDEQALCKYVESLGPSKFPELIPEVFNPFWAGCGGMKVEKEALNPAEYARQHQLDPALVSLVYEIDQRDRQFRSLPDGDMDQQRVIDRENMALIDSLYAVHQTYLGESLVGPELSTAMWAVIQHSELEYMERYLPILHAAVESEEVPGNTTLKMLIDRIFWLRTGKQVFGSQASVPLVKESIRDKVRERYNID